MKKISLLLFSMVPLLGTVSCSNKKWRIASTNFVRNIEVDPKIKYLYEVTYTDYDLDYALQERKDVITDYETFKNAPGGCSSARVKGFVGRNLDLPYGKFAEVIVNVPKSDKHFASVASFNALQSFGGKNEIEPNELNDTLYHLIPISVCDGINENGVVCEMNVVPVQDITPTTYTDKTKEDLNLANVTRFVLDNATSASHAIRLLRNKNICNPWDWSGSVKKGWEYHYMIADAWETYIVEFVNNEMRVLKDNASANYYLSIIEGTPHGMGLERYRKLKEGVEELEEKSDTEVDVADIAELMQKTYWTQSNKIDVEADICYSDHFGSKAKDGTEITKDNFTRYLEDLKEIAKKEDEETLELINTDADENPLGLWITLHTCVFDIKNRAMNFYIHEPTDVATPSVDPYYVPGCKPA